MGLSLKQVGRALEDPDLTPAALVVDLIRCTEERLAQERELLDRLRAIDASAPADWRDVLRVIDLMRDLDSESAARRQQAVLIRSAGAPVPVELLAEMDRLRLDRPGRSLCTGHAAGAPALAALARLSPPRVAGRTSHTRRAATPDDPDSVYLLQELY